MKIEHLRDLAQLEALGWKTSGFRRWEDRWYSRIRPLEASRIAQERPGHPTDLGWVLEGGPRTADLSASQRYVLHVVAETGSTSKAVKLTGMEKSEVEEVLSEVERKVYRSRKEIG